MVAIVLFAMPVGQALLAGTEGAAFGFFPILWIVINAIWVYNLTVATGHFDVLRRSFEKVSPDQRIQAIIIAFCFGALLEALAGFGTPVAITVVMLMALGFRAAQGRGGRADRQHRAGRVRCAGHPDRHAGRRSPPAPATTRGLTVDTLGAMVGRQTPILAVVVPLVLVFVVDGRRGVRQTWLPALVCGVAFGLAQFVAANYISVPLADIVAALVSAAAVVLLLRVWQPGRGAHRRRDAPRRPARARRTRPAGRRAAAAVRRRRTGRRRRPPGPAAPADARRQPRRGRQGLRAVPRHHRDLLDRQHHRGQGGLAEEPWTYASQWPGLDVLNPAGEPVASTTFNFNWLPAAGTLMIFAGIITAVILKVSPARGAADLRRHLRRAEARRSSP